MVADSKRRDGVDGADCVSFVVTGMKTTMGYCTGELATAARARSCSRVGCMSGTSASDTEGWRAQLARVAGDRGRACVHAGGEGGVRVVGDVRVGHHEGDEGRGMMRLSRRLGCADATLDAVSR